MKTVRIGYFNSLGLSVGTPVFSIFPCSSSAYQLILRLAHLTVTDATAVLGITW